MDKFFYENKYYNEGAKYVCGVDEVGRGPLAGAVTVCAIIMDREKIVEGVDDSKKLSEKKREALYDQILEAAVACSVVSLDNNVVDEINILNATKRAMREAVISLSVSPDVVLIDAVDIDVPFKTHSIIRGDSLSYTIGCASIVAKVTRDRIMRQYDEIYPEYGFKSNKGYGSAAHIEALKKYGATPIHRKTFIKNFVCADEK